VRKLISLTVGDIKKLYCRTD